MKSFSIVTAGMVLGTISSVVSAQETIEPIVVTATRTEFRDTEAPYASEVHNRQSIEQSGAASLYDYLDKYSSVTVMPSYGNPFSQKLDMRGYGIGDGYQNIVISVDGHRLNNIDMVPQLLSAIPLDGIERIEIIKGSGSIISGDGATAGIINIITRDIDGATLNVAAGSHGIASSSVSAGLSTDRLALSVLAENYRHEGFRDPDITGKRDEADSNNTRAQLRLYPTDIMELHIAKELSWIDTLYGGSLTEVQFNADPEQNGGATYTGQVFHTDNTSIGLSADLTPEFKLTIDHNMEDKSSEYSSGWHSDYDYHSGDLALHYNKADYGLMAGMQQFDGTRSSLFDDTSKKNSSAYLYGHYRFKTTTLAVGARSETVEYRYQPSIGTALSDDHKLSAWDVGINQRINERLTLFANYNSAYQAPDIDRFFSGGTFNAFISPARSRTLNIGLNHAGSQNKLKVTLFHVDLKNEIYYYNTGSWLTSYNTNIDKSHKYGLELQDSYQFSDTLDGSLNYTYTRAIIDSENEGAGSYDGKDLPGVSPHSLSLNVNYLTSPKTTLTLTHTYRSEAYAANDFANNFTQKQAAYHSTDLGYQYRVKQVELFIKVNNLLAQSNGLWVSDDVIYPVNFERTWRIGIRSKF